MSNSLTDRLGRFTPDGTGLDRDAILFAAGRASVRPERPWKTIAAVLALTQALTLALLLPWSDSRPSSVPKEVVPAPTYQGSENPSSLSMQRQLDEALRDVPSVGSATYAPDVPTWSARNVLHALPVN